MTAILSIALITFTLNNQAFLKSVEGSAQINYNNPLMGIKFSIPVNSEEKATFDESNIQPLGNNSQTNTNDNRSMISG